MVWCHLCVCGGLAPKSSYTKSSVSQHRRNSPRGTVIDKKWLIRTGHIWGFRSKWARGCPTPKNLLGSSFIIKGEEGRRGEGETFPVFLSRPHASIISSSSRLSRVFLFLPGQAGPQIVFHMCREHVLGIINLLSSLGRMWGSCHHCFIIWGHVSCFCLMVLLLSKPAWFCG